MILVMYWFKKLQILSTNEGILSSRGEERIHIKHEFITVDEREGQCHILVNLLITGDRVVGTTYDPQRAITKRTVFIHALVEISRQLGTELLAPLHRQGNRRLL